MDGQRARIAAILCGDGCTVFLLPCRSPRRDPVGAFQQEGQRVVREAAEDALHPRSGRARQELRERVEECECRP